MKTLLTLIPVGAAICALTACTSPDVSPEISNALSVVQMVSKTTDGPLKAQAALDLQLAEANAAANSKRIVALPAGCVARIADITRNVSDCKVIETALPDDAPVNATQVLAALNVLEDYFTALLDLATSTSPDEVRTKTTALLAAVDTFAKANDGRALDVLQRRVAQRGEVTAASLGFVAKQARRNAVLRTMRQGDRVIKDLVDGMQPVLLDIDGPATQLRSDVITALNTYSTALNDKAPQSAQVDAANAVKGATARMHRAEKQSSIRKLYLVRDLHAAMLARFQGGGDIIQFQTIVVDLTEILTLLEDT